VRRTYVAALNTERCVVCYDYFAELADVVAGTTMPTHGGRCQGETATLIRTDVGRRLMEDAEAAKYIGTEPMRKEDFNMSGWELKKHANFCASLSGRDSGTDPDYHWPLDYPVPMREELTVVLRTPHVTSIR